jgi:NADH:ubiquinone oxidoreductase subunit H
VTSKVPFDLPEAEAELVAGYDNGYFSMGFAFWNDVMRRMKFTSFQPRQAD